MAAAAVDEGLMTVKEVAALLRVEPMTIYNLIYRGELPSFKVGASRRFKRSAIEAYIRRQEDSAAHTAPREEVKS